MRFWAGLKTGFAVLLTVIGMQMACAHEYVYEEPKVDPDKALFSFVSSIQLNGVEISDEVQLNQIDHIFRQAYKLEDMQYQPATGDLHIWFSMPGSSATFWTDFSGLPQQDYETIHREFEASEDNKSRRWEALLKQNDGKWLLQSDILGAWDIRWAEMDRFQEELKLDGVMISPDLTLTQFAAMFPRTMNSESDWRMDAPEEDGRICYYVSLAPMMYDDLPYWDHLEFVFEGEKLVELSLTRGIRY